MIHHVNLPKQGLSHTIMSMNKRVLYFLKNYWYVLIVVAVAVFLRLYRLEGFATFLSDQGRDAIIVKRIVTFQHFPAIGASSSVGQVYLGPFYYYLIAPFLLLFNFNPVGLVFGVAFFSIIGIIFSYYVIKKEFNAIIAFFFLLLVTFSSVNIDASRFSWNPNLLPFFSFFTLYWFYRFSQTNKIRYAILLGAFFSFSIQLHYLAGFLIIPMLLYYLLSLRTVKHILQYLIHTVISLTVFALFTSPLIIFDLRHNFLNIKNLIKLFTIQGVVSNASLVQRISETVQSFFAFTLMSQISVFISFTILLALFLILITSFRAKQSGFLHIHFLNIFTYLLFFSLLNSARHAHYYHAIYLSFFLVSAYIFAGLIRKKLFDIGTIACILFFIGYIFANSQHYTFLYQKPNNQIQQAKQVANFLAEKIDHKPFNIATWPVEFFEDSYLYFLELKGIIPADRAKVQVTNQMFVLCNQEPCKVLDSPSWNISMFGQAKIENIWTVDGLKIYKLIHAT